MAYKQINLSLISLRLLHMIFSSQLILLYMGRLVMQFHAATLMQFCHPFHEKRSIPESCERYLWSLWKHHRLLLCWSSSHTPHTGLDGSWNANICSHFGKYMDAPVVLKIEVHIITAPQLIIRNNSYKLEGWQHQWLQ